MARKGMMWEELDLRRTVPDEDIRRGLAAVFAIEPEAVAVIDSFGDADPWADQRARVAVERRSQEGDFPLHLTVVLDSGLKTLVQTVETTLQAVKSFCALIKSDCLLSDESLDPYSWQLVHGTGVVERVRVDPAALDEHNSLVLAQWATPARRSGT